MQRGNGAVIGKQNTPTTSVATGVWALNEVQRAVLGGNWPASTIVDPYFDYTTLLLHGNGTNGAQNNTFLDSSTNNFTITRNGNTTQGTFTPYGSNWSNYFDGSGDYLQLADSTAWDLTGDYTIEMWLYKTASSSQTFFMLGSGGSTSILLYQNASNSIIFLTSSAVITASTAAPLNQWNHLALVRSGSGSNNTVMYLNGVNVGQATNTASFTGDASNGVRIGAEYPTGFEFAGYISNLRIVKSAVYTGAFTPPTSPLTAITNTSLLTCQSNRFIDNSSNNFTITRNGDVSVQRFSPFNPTTPYAAGTIGGSGYFDGSGDYLVCGVASDWAFMSNSTALWSVEMWVYPTTLGSNDRTLLDTAQSTTGNVGMAMTILTNRTVQVEIYRGSAGTYVVTGSSTSTLVANQWNHIVVTYDQSLASQNLKFYINGGSAETANKTANAPSSSNPNRAMTIATYGAGVGQFLTGYIGSMRISNVIRSSGVPTAPYTSDANTVLLTNYTNGGIIDNAMMNDLETVGNAQISTSVSKFGGGSLYFDGSGDYLLPSSAGTNNPLALGSGDFTLEFWLNFAALGDVTVIDWRPTSTNGAYPTLYMDVGTNKIVYYANSANRITSSTVFTTSTWYHIALVRSGGSTKLYINGTNEGATYTDSTNYLAAAVRPIIGANGAGGGTNAINAYIDDLRITKGYARYTANFSVPTAPFPDQ